MRPHPLTTVVRRCLPQPLGAGAVRYLELLDRRLAALEDLAAGRPVAPEALRERASDLALARRLLAPYQATWDDGDENLVRGFLDRWVRPGEDPVRAASRSLVEAAHALAGMNARPETLWFFLWEMESMLADLALSQRPSNFQG